MRSTYCDNDCLQTFILPVYYSVMAKFIKNSHIQATILVIIFWDIFMFDKILVSPQVKQIVIISNKHGIYELSLELPHDLGLTILGN